MVNFNKSKKAVELALNTIVIAILIIIVLLVIVLIFTNKIGDTSKALNDNSATACNMNNAVIKTLGYKDVQPFPKSTTTGTPSCSGNYPEEISTLGTFKADGQDKVCCGIKQ